MDKVSDITKRNTASGYSENHITVVICTHNRYSLLKKALASLFSANIPSNCSIEILVIANACSDNTGEFLDSVKKSMHRMDFRWAIEEKIGKSNAINHALSLINDGIVAFVDDDQVVDNGFFSAINDAIDSYASDGIYCGKILPDWDGSEPDWIHDKGKYRIYPVPIPCSDRGETSKRINITDKLPGGGGLFIRYEVFEKVGPFSVELGPDGNSLKGGEDLDYLRRALKTGFTLRYIPDVIQYHYVNPDHFKLRYLLKKSYFRTQANTLLLNSGTNKFPAYLIRKLVRYISLCAVSFRWSAIRFYLVRIAATMGEISAHMQLARAADVHKDTDI